MALEEAQKSFIEKRVTELGSLEEVMSFYTPGCEVYKYALKMVKKLGLPEIHPEGVSKFVLPPQPGRENYVKFKRISPTSYIDEQSEKKKKVYHKRAAKTEVNVNVHPVEVNNLYQDALNKVLSESR